MTLIPQFEEALFDAVIAERTGDDPQVVAFARRFLKWVDQNSAFAQGRRKALPEPCEPLTSDRLESVLHAELEAILSAYKQAYSELHPEELDQPRLIDEDTDTDADTEPAEKNMFEL